MLIEPIRWGAEADERQMDASRAPFTIFRVGRAAPSPGAGIGHSR
jgi:hypothetical protein